MPTLRHSRGLIARALSLGRATLPEWLAERHLDASVRLASGATPQASQVVVRRFEFGTDLDTGDSSAA